MGSSTKFPSGLNKWALSDKPEMDDFVNDNQLLDANTMWKATYDSDGSIADAGGISPAVEAIVEAAVEAAVNAAAQNITALVLARVFPVGSYYISESDENPATLIGFGVWERASIGKMLVGVNTGDTDFNTAGKTGGSKTASLPLGRNGAAQTVDISNATYYNYSQYTSKTWQATYSVSRAQSSVTHSNISWYTPLMGTTETGSVMNPYETAYIWKRVE